VKLLLFDLDQTLVNTGGAGLRALNRACCKVLSIENAVDGISPHGKTDPAIVREILQIRLGSDSFLDVKLHEILESYIEYLGEEVRVSSRYRVLPGIREVLDELYGRPDVMLGLATGNVETGARIKLQPGDLNRYFRFGGYGSDSENRVELVRRAAEAGCEEHGRRIRPEDVFVIGDTPLDVDAAIRAGFTAVGVGTGTYSVEELLDSGAAFAISDFKQGRNQFFRSTFSV
jgi:phosphoglycolate phosphatase-like HAD superfamily hydrolase